MTYRTIDNNTLFAMFRAHSLLSVFFSMANHSSILLIEDSPGECELFRQALIKSELDVALFTEHDIDAALHFLKTHEDLPSLTLLDWHLHNRHGDSFLQRLRSETRFVGIPVVILTTSDDASDVTAAYVNGANGYVVKPSTFDQLVNLITDLYRYWLTWNRTVCLVRDGS